ncbi:alpha/beta hydrolase [Aliiglaciecola sp. 3_MG-2023]|uniref:alpha/beta hydrolase n=1 Tax=Aliiglaciecola sp. 3_MG-2023 TaxID=3062644 RepID=UPI0026E16257|nr:alpha/beta hydrolase [Aliiglaciecola sp. 3_MG-2023]MDO6695520.1 alpha/beta hydrolase [Aliiglaciecola sp. 3_MG-2023]
MRSVLTLLLGQIAILAMPLFATEISVESMEVKIDEHPLHVSFWGEKNALQKPWVVLISGPIDSWHSDSAWFAASAPILAQHYRVIAIDRAATVVNLADAPVGYTHFALDLNLTLQHFNIQNATLVAFASSNISAQIALQENREKRVSNVVLIDPDVLSEFSIARYNQDALPFKNNLEKYLTYISQHKYSARVKQKNQADLEKLTSLSTLATTNWQYVTKLMDKRLEIHNQKNLFIEIANYHQDLQQAAKLVWPQHIPTVIIDTQFEDSYIAQTDNQEQKAGLIKWQKDGTEYYQRLVRLSDQNRYLTTPSKAHLFQFERPFELLSIIQQLRE